ncbi:hypothetical protein F511_05886 [Dorcoceras hygrometricum]|uniref:RING-type domain-containing protein n=1 Tax=Dorcoceras hygrometricum TaxID=472368 RepID=A0A2Z7D2X6_9LAMI|nr:hypothetical protein F511_05886 [Dorcoceras hygrometricum]
MGERIEILGFGLQARIEIQRGARTIMELFRDRMEGVDRTVRRKKSLKERLGFNGMSCCGGAAWGLGPTTMDEEDCPTDPETSDPNGATQSTPPCDTQSAAASGTNLADALAAERQFRAAQDSVQEGSNQSPSLETPPRMSLMRLLEETDGRDEGRKVEEDGGGWDPACCVCMGRNKGAAFIPCGHTFCRVCSRDLWLNRGTCPLCNGSILEILDIY